MGTWAWSGGKGGRIDGGSFPSCRFPPDPQIPPPPPGPPFSISLSLSTLLSLSCPLISLPSGPTLPATIEKPPFITPPLTHHTLYLPPVFCCSARRLRASVKYIHPTPFPPLSTPVATNEKPGPPIDRNPAASLLPSNHPTKTRTPHYSAPLQPHDDLPKHHFITLPPFHFISFRFSTRFSSTTSSDTHFISQCRSPTTFRFRRRRLLPAFALVGPPNVSPLLLSSPSKRSDREKS